ncbi:hypothetical protein RB653_006075 [Dictyostelium firmibasis]|uniref:J domain-containing protein n=1 Tax=Dictyostelium firmibasis TaxID=79012 RepID=A0AAN7YTH4_9MYCE
MESNKEESIRCIEIAVRKYNEGNLESCIKFLNKSISLYPNDRAKELLATYTSTTTTSSTSTQTSTDGHGGTSTKTTTTKTTTSETINESIKPKYTVEQVAAVKRIKACKSFYDVLEIKKDANEIDIKKAYRKIALQMHPDKNQAPGAEDAFKIVTQAFSCLSDPRKRQTYDLHGSEEPTNRSPFSRGGGGGGMYYEDDISPEDIFNIFFGIPTNGARNRRAGGNHYYATSMGGSPFGNGVQFNFGGAPMNRRRSQHQHHHHQPQQETQESAYSLLIILIPLILFFLSLFGSGSGSSAGISTNYKNLYEFSQSQQFQKERIIPVDLESGDKIDIQYFVKVDFEKLIRQNSFNIKSFEKDVADRWVNFKAPLCKKKKQLDDSLIKDPSNTSIKKELSKSQYKYCDVLNKNKIFK